MKLTIYIFFLVVLCGNLHAQKDSIQVKETQIKAPVYNALAPAKAAFLSALIPGAGQIYNNKYWWQLPLIYGGLGVSIYSYIDSNNSYNRFRTAFRRRAAGLSDEFTVDGVEIISDSGLESNQERANTNRNYSIFSAILIYILQITEASVRAHLLQFDTSKDLSLIPSVVQDHTLVEAPKAGLTLKYSF